VLFPSQAWLAAVLAAVDRHPDLPRALSGLGTDLAVVVEAEPPAVPYPVAAWGRHERGHIAEWRLLEDQDEILDLEPAYVVRGPYRLWKDLLRRRADPFQAALSGKLRVEGDLEALVKRANYRHVVEEALARVATEFPDEVGR
jgi:SCP-2 sterol transfer family protein